MEELIKIALSTEFHNVEQIMEVLKATPNPEVGAQILLGIYKEPKIPETPRSLNFFPENQRNIKFIKYDKFTNEVFYSYNKLIIKHGFIPIDAEEKPKNFVSTKAWEGDAAKELGISLDEFNSKYKKVAIPTDFERDSSGNIKEFTSSIYLDNWM
jgi:hypothetical protein